MQLSELEDHVAITLNQLHVTHKKMSVMRGSSTQFMVDDFGLVVCCINRVDYAQVNDAVVEQFKGWRTVYITTNDDITEMKYRILWALMRGGYMKWLRYNFPRQVKNTLNGTDNLAQLIIKERLRLWGDNPKYRFFVEDNKVALRNGILRELTSDPSFFDYMPEEE